MLDVRSPNAEFLSKARQARCAQVDMDAGMLALYFPMKVSLQRDVWTGGPAATTAAAQRRSSWRDQIQDWNADWALVMEVRAMAAAPR